MKKIIATAGVALLPIFTFADGFGSVTAAIDSSKNIINSLIPLVIGIAVLLFLIGILGYITAGGDEEKRAAARSMIIFGIIALFVMTAVWGFVKILGTTFFGGSDITTPVQGPRV